MGQIPNLNLQVVVVPILALAMLCTINIAFGDTMSTRPAVDTFKENQMKLYDALHKFILPDLDYDSNVQQRFVLQVPGKILNPIDFDPGQEYIDYLNEPENYTKRVDIPRQVMENMFHIVDVVPGAHPVTGESTGYSLAKLYESILDNMEQIGFDDLSEQGRKKYYEALNRLVELVPDPDDPSSHLPLFDLYTKLQNAYHDEQQKVDKTLREKSKQLEPADYQLWLERHHHIFDAQIDTAYGRWLLYGQKHLTESYLRYLDFASSDKSLQKARLALRLSEFISQDLSQNVYPVSLTPPDWFKHLNPSRNTSPTRHQLLAKQEDLKSRIALLEKMSEKSITTIEAKQLRVVEQDSDQKLNNVWLKVEELEYTRKRCWLIFDSLCNFWTKEEEVKDALFKSTGASFKVEMLKWQFGDNSSLKDQIELVLMKLRNESKQLEEEIDNVSSTVSPIVNDMGTVESLSLEEIQDQWRYFEFFSTTDHNDASATYNSIGDVHLKPSIFLGDHVFASYVQNGKVVLKAKLLKVEINRPWFRESLFHDREFKLNKKDKLVSPGYMNEIDFYNEVTKKNSDGSPVYQLYQYPTAFLLAKDITMDFTGLTDEEKQSAIMSSYSNSLKGNYGPISFGGSFSTSGSYSHIQVSLRANGLTVYIPGAQIIGYYCDIIPKFPNTYNSSEFPS